MIEIITQDQLISFDGRVLEIFSARGEVQRYHIKLIQRIELKDKSRECQFQIDYTELNMPVRLGISSDYAAQAEDMLRAIETQLSNDRNG